MRIFEKEVPAAVNKLEGFYFDFWKRTSWISFSRWFLANNFLISVLSFFSFEWRFFSISTDKSNWYKSFIELNPSQQHCIGQIPTKHHIVNAISWQVMLIHHWLKHLWNIFIIIDGWFDILFSWFLFHNLNSFYFVVSSVVSVASISDNFNPVCLLISSRSSATFFNFLNALR